MKNDRATLIDIVLIGALVVLSVVTIWSLAADHVSRWVSIGGLVGIITVALSLVFARFATRPDHVRALQSRTRHSASFAKALPRRAPKPSAASC